MEQENKIEDKLIMNGQEVKLKSPGTEALKDFLLLAKAMSRIPKDKQDANFMEYLDDKAIDSATNLINMTLKKTFKEYDDEIDSWGMKHSMLILPKVIEMCSPSNLTDDNKRKDELMKKIGR